MNEHGSSSDAVAVSQPPLDAGTPTASSGGTSPRTDKFRSGYQRAKFRLQRLYAEIDDLKLE
jgi:hypothetical protein